MVFATSAMPCWGKKSTKMVPRAFPKQLSNQHPNLHRFWSQLASILGGFWEPSWGQVGTKSLQKSIQKMIKKMITFWMALGSDFWRFWLPLGGSRGDPRMDPRMTFGGLFGSWGPDPPKSPPRAPQEPPRAPKTPSKLRFWDVLGPYVYRFFSVI